LNELRLPHNKFIEAANKSSELKILNKYKDMFVIPQQKKDEIRLNPVHWKKLEENSLALPKQVKE
jgi:hypothetical protein